MSATTELRRMLDERGVEWADIATGCKRSHITLWRDADGMEWQYYEDTRTGWTLLQCRRDYLTPEQAIEATLGRGMCRNTEQLPLSWSFTCSECGVHSITEGERFNYCPNCGAEVVSE